MRGAKSEHHHHRDGPLSVRTVPMAFSSAPSAALGTSSWLAWLAKQPERAARPSVMAAGPCPSIVFTHDHFTYIHARSWSFSFSPSIRLAPHSNIAGLTSLHNKQPSATQSTSTVSECLTVPRVARLGAGLGPGWNKLCWSGATSWSSFYAQRLTRGLTVAYVMA